MKQHDMLALEIAQYERSVSELNDAIKTLNESLQSEKENSQGLEERLAKVNEDRNTVEQVFAVLPIRRGAESGCDFRPVIPDRGFVLACLRLSLTTENLTKTLTERHRQLLFVSMNGSRLLLFILRLRLQ